MNWESHVRNCFRYLNHALAIGIVLIGLYVFTVLFIPAIGGPFPQRVRGPLAEYEFYKLGILPEWENVIQQTDESGRILPHILIDEYSRVQVPPLQFGAPPAQPASAVPEATAQAIDPIPE